MEHYNYARLWRLNTPEQRDLLVVRLFLSGNIPTFVEWLADGLPLNAFMLSELALCHAYGEDKQYQEIILAANVFEDNAKLWLEEFLPPKTLLNLLEQKPELVSETFPSNDFCVKQELWDILMERKAYDAIAPVNPDLLLSCEDNAALSALLKVNAEKYINLAFERGLNNLVLSCKDGWKYLIDFDQAEWLFKNKCVMNIGLISEAEVAEYCYQKGLIDLLYKYGYYSKLLDHEEFEIFIKNHSTFSRFLSEYPEKVNWNDLWKEHPRSRNYLLLEARINSHVPNNNKFLWKHPWGVFKTIVW